MPELTPNIGLKKPLGNEPVNRESYNAVLDQIDGAVGGIQTTVASQLTAQNTQMQQQFEAQNQAVDGKLAAVDTALSDMDEAKQDKPILLTLTLTGGAAAWPDNVQTVDAPGVVLGDGQVGRPLPADEAAYTDAEIKLLPATEAGKATFQCGSVPSVDLVVRLMLMEVTPYVAG